MRKESLMNRISNRPLENLFHPSLNYNHPVLVASHRWKIVSDQLKDLLGNDVYRQWFENITAMYITNNVLILRVRDRMSCTWITSHYQDLVDVLLSFQDQQLTCFMTTEDDLPLRPLDYLEFSGAVS
ncbi:MAG: DnaA N-terminal domain-containing protein [Bacteriovoracaceae bacterium]|nr:DnaA N-terminal domain-containing protein [Bacteriovoracaceae bacterium]